MSLEEAMRLPIYERKYFISRFVEQKQRENEEREKAIKNARKK